jgi:ferric-dicitrate binding protein FerR (iron transport regulator)
VRYQQSDDRTGAAPVYHTLVIPKGGQYQLILPDGTGVWLNAGSSIRFPTAFNGALRRVEVTGEVYFEVARQVERPFRVTVGGMEVDVLGTAFNVSAYAGEKVSTTLIGGSVALRQRGYKVQLRPGEMGYFDGVLLQRERADTLSVMAWRRGVFRFRKAPMLQVAGELERWYNISFEFDQNYNPTKQFNGEISRGIPLSKVLAMLEKTGIGHFKLQQGKVLIMPAD